MKNFPKLVGITAFVVVMGFTFAACDNGSTSGGNLDGTAWRDSSNHPWTLTFTGSNYVLNADGMSNGTYTLSGGTDLEFKETSPGTRTFEAYYYGDENPPYILLYGLVRLYKE